MSKGRPSFLLHSRLHLLQVRYWWPLAGSASPQRRSQAQCNRLFAAKLSAVEANIISLQSSSFALATKQPLPLLH